MTFETRLALTALAVFVVAVVIVLWPRKRRSGKTDTSSGVGTFWFSGDHPERHGSDSSASSSFDGGDGGGD